MSWFEFMGTVFANIGAFCATFWPVPVFLLCFGLTVLSVAAIGSGLSSEFPDEEAKWWYRPLWLLCSIILGFLSFCTVLYIMLTIPVPN